MSIKEMDPIQHVKPCESGEKQVLKFSGCEPKIFVNGCHTFSLIEVLKSLRKEEVLCDIRLETADNKIVCGHKVVLVSASLYFRTMFTSLTERNKDVVKIKELDYNILQLLVDYIYTGKIMVTEQNVQVLLPAAILLQLDYVKGACVEFLQKQLNPSNCLGIKKFTDFYNCCELLSSSEEYIKKQFLKVVEAEEFLSLSSEEEIKLISSNDINVPFEEKVFECVINWVNHELDSRRDSLSKLMEHVRLPLTSQEYISINVVEEPLLKNNPKCKDFIIEALNFHILKKHLHITIPQTIRNTPRQSGHKFILAICDTSKINSCYTSWYDPATKLLHKTTEMSMSYGLCALALIKEHLVFALGNSYKNSRSIEMLDLSSQSPCWISVVNMLVKRNYFGVGVIDDCIYAVGGFSVVSYLNSVEVFNVNIQEWRLVSSMSTKRMDLGVGVLNNFLYVIGGYNYPFSLKSVECYDPIIDTWTPVTNMSISRRCPGVGVLNGIIYAIGGESKNNNSSVIHKCVEAYTTTTKVWSSIADMNLCRSDPSVVTFNGLLYVIGGFDGSNRLNSVEIYNPNTNTWSMDTLSTSVDVIHGAVVVKRPPYFKTD